MMKPTSHFFAFCFALQVGLLPCQAHDNTTVHPAISEGAVKSSAGLSKFLGDTFGYGIDGVNLPSFGDAQGSKTPLSPIEWVKNGSVCEDKPSVRGKDHFYDPTKNPAIGLTDGLDDWGEPSFKWASEAYYDAWPLHNKSYPWPDARAYEFSALTNSTKLERDANLAKTLFYLGHVLHLNQDLSVPAHVRNDNHMVDGTVLNSMWTEKYGKEHWANNPQWFVNPSQHDWPWWHKTAGFQKLEDFWNRDLLRKNGATDLDAEAKGDVTLGLSEFCGGNFISEDASYGELIVKTTAKHYFQYPSLMTSTRFSEVQANPAAFLKTTTLPNGNLAKRPFIQKAYDGVYVTNHSVLNYLGTKFPTKHLKRSITIHDDNVLQEYHDKLIPKAVEYSAGILDYFFRGTMEVSASYDADAHQCTVTNLNTSGQDFHGGGFFCFGEGTHGVRTLLASKDWTENTLANGDSMTMTFDGPIPPGARLLSVYQGTIGWANDDALDPVDKGIGIAFGRSWIEQIKAYSYEPSLDELGLQPGATITTNLESDDFAFTPAAGNYEVKINYADFDDKGAIGSVASSGPITSCTYAGEITNTIVPLNEVTVVGNHLRVPVTATDDPACADEIGWRRIVITWRAWPVNAP